MAEWFTCPLSSLAMFAMATASARATGGMRPRWRNSGVDYPGDETEPQSPHTPGDARDRSRRSGRPHPLFGWRKGDCTCLIG